MGAHYMPELARARPMPVGRAGFGLGLFKWASPMVPDTKLITSLAIAHAHPIQKPKMGTRYMPEFGKACPSPPDAGHVWNQAVQMGFTYGYVSR